MASMKDVAKRAGVSVSTVSRVISGKIPVDHSTQSAVLAAIAELKYRPDLVASGLRTKSAKSVGLIVPRISDPFFMALIDHADRSVVSHGCNLLLFSSRSDVDFEEKIVDDLLRRHVDGIIFAMVSDESRTLKLLSHVDVPVVMLDRVFNTTRFMNLVVDNRKAGELAAEHLLALGHRRIACLTGPGTIHLSLDRLRGFRETLKAAGVALRDDAVVHGDFNFEFGFASAETVLRMRPTPTAVWAQNDLMAAGLLKRMTQLGVKVPEGLSILGMDDLGVPEIVEPSLSTIAQPVREMAERAVRLIFEAKRNNAVQRRITLKPRLVVRDSTAAYKGKQEG